MTEKRKRFELMLNSQGQVDIVDYVESEEKNAICIYNDLGVLPFSSASSLCDLLNQLNDENEQLRNKKERYKKLSEIRQQQIDNRILTIKEFINNCSDNKVRSTLKELFYSEVNEYDLSSEKRKLLNENEQLKKQLNYIQNLISEHIKHQKTELGQKALQEIIQDYNEWLLGHKEVKE